MFIQLFFKIKIEILDNYHLQSIGNIGNSGEIKINKLFLVLTIIVKVQ